MKKKNFIEVGLLNNYIHVSKKHKCQVNIDKNNKREFIINGIFFCQQNSISSCCAHACLCMAINNMKELERKITSVYINNVLEIHNYWNPSRGLSAPELFKVINELNLKIVYTNYADKDYPPIAPFNENIYSYLESRFPVLLAFKTRISQCIEAHVVAVVGHTLNTDIWKGEPQRVYVENHEQNEDYCKSSEWVDHFIINDDNFGMYLCLPIDLLKKEEERKGEEAEKKGESEEQCFRADESLVILPYELKTLPKEAEAHSVYTFKQFLNYIMYYKAVDVFGDWIGRIIEEYRSYRRPFLTRTLFIGREDYRKHLKISKDFLSNKCNNEEIKKTVEVLPERFWLTEVTLPDLYSTNRSKIVDIIYPYDQVIIPPEAFQQETQDSLAARVIKACKLMRFPKLTFTDMSFLVDSSINPANTCFPNSYTTYVNLFNFDKDDDTLEW